VETPSPPAFGLPCADPPASRRFWDRWTLAAILASIALILALQIAAGAYRSDFDGFPDESAHLVSGLMVYDFLTTWPHHPVGWGISYYLHYPKVAIGHWPPGFPMMEALWWLLFGPSRWSTILLEGALTAAAATVFYRLARHLTQWPLAFAATILLIGAPVTSMSFSMGMADVPCLLWSVLLLDSTVRIFRRPATTSFLWAGFVLACALLTKGTGVCLIAVPAFTLILAGKWRYLLLRPIAWVVGFVAVGSAWYLIQSVAFHHSVSRSGGMSVSLPWPVYLVPPLAGYGVFTLAIGGIFASLSRRAPEALAAASLLVSSLATAFALRAMNDSRHWIIVLPALLLLAIECLVWLERFRWVRVVAALAALTLFPFGLERLPASGFQRFTTEIHHPARMLVSSNGDGEGAWIAAVALSEKRPSSVVIRASKVLASEDWNGNDYKLLTTSPGEVQTTLDQLGVETVVLQILPGKPVPPHQVLLNSVMQAGAAWRQCANDGSLTAWCRTRPPTVPRRPLRIDLRDKIGRVIEESPAP
jgi:dolichyl-phosphate-mannose-protein mannosyltransferase